MTVTKTIINDFIVPEVFNPYVIERTAKLSAFYQSGIIARNAELDRLASSGGKLINMPFWEDLTGEDEVLSDTEALTVGKIQASQDVAALLARGRAWSVNDLAKALSGDDPMAAIGNLVAAYWARRFQAVLLQSLAGGLATRLLAWTLTSTTFPALLTLKMTMLSLPRLRWTLSTSWATAQTN